MKSMDSLVLDNIQMTNIKKSGIKFKKIVWLALIALLYNVATAAVPASPELYVSVDDKTVSLIWNVVDEADGFTLFYAPYPNGKPIRSIDLGDATIISAKFPVGSAYFVALQSYNEEGISDYSNVEHFIVSDDDAELPQITFTFGESMDSSARSRFRKDALRTEAFFTSQSLPRFQPAAMFHAYDDYDELLDAFIETYTASLRRSLGLGNPTSELTLSEADENWGGGNGQGVAFGNNVFISTTSPFWREFASEAHKTRVVAHELFHVLQYQLIDAEFSLDVGGDTKAPLAGPRWLIEGSAELASFKMLDWAGLSDFDVDLQWAIDNAADSEYLLEELESSPGYISVIETAGQISFTAVSFLSPDLSKYASYFSSISNEVQWEEAFFQAFGITIESFYEEYDLYQSNGYQN